MKTLVVLAGLMVVVPRVDPRGEWQGLTVLVLNAEKDTHLGGAGHHHVTSVTELGGKLFKPLTGEWTLESKAVGPIELVGEDRLLVLERLYGRDSPLPPMRPDCYGNNFKKCTDTEGNPLVRAILNFKGGWRVRPIEITHDREPRAMIYDDSYWAFVPFPANKLVPQPSPSGMQLSGGLILEPLDEADLSIKETIKDKQYDVGPLTPLGRQVCALFAGYPEPCAVLRFLNVMHAMSFPTERQTEIDFTQDMIYDLFGPELNPGPPVRYMTALRRDARPEIMDLLYPAGGGSPFPRPCPPPTFAPQVEVEVTK